MGKGLKLAAPPPRRPSEPATTDTTPKKAEVSAPKRAKVPKAVKAAPAASAVPESDGAGQKGRGGAKTTPLDHTAASELVQMNQRVRRDVKKAYAHLAIELDRSLGDLVTEGLELLQEKYGRT